ncbi:hypothetical protein [Aquabacterium sp.]|uniref:hypothetical protein n=1 Tax=Aquabacterium sp. TaxID=1872578 RepID=UPI003BB02F78
MNEQQKHLLNEVQQVIDQELANGKFHSCAEYDEKYRTVLAEAIRYREYKANNLARAASDYIKGREEHIRSNMEKLQCSEAMFKRLEMMDDERLQLRTELLALQQTVERLLAKD